MDDPLLNMDERLIGLFDQELRHLRETAREFGRAFPSKAAALGVMQTPADPYVERLMEGAAFMAARVRLRLEAQFPHFTQSLIETTYPDFLAPVPSMILVQLKSAPSAPPPPTGLLVDRGTMVKGLPVRNEEYSRISMDPTPCLFSTAHPIRLLPIEISQVEFLVRRLPETGADKEFGARAALRIRLKRTSATPWKEIDVAPLVLHLPALDGLGYELIEHLFAHQIGLSIREGGKIDTTSDWRRTGPAVLKYGFEPHQALLPSNPRTFDGYRLLREYFAMPQRFLFVELADFKEGLARCQGEVAEIIIPLKEESRRLEREVERSCFQLFCAPAVNLFKKTFSQTIQPERFSEFHAVPDLNRPLDYEVHTVEEVHGFTSSSRLPRPFLPFYQTRHRSYSGAAFFTLNREPRTLSESERSGKWKMPYPGSEVYLALVDQMEVPFSGDLEQIHLTTRCTNRHLPVMLRDNQGKWSLEGGIKAEVTLLVQPTLPYFRPVDGEYAWRLLNLFSLNYLSLAEEEQAGAAALRELLSLHSGETEWGSRQIDALRHVTVETTTQPVYSQPGKEGKSVFEGVVRGLRVGVEFEESAFQDRHVFLLGAVLEEFFAKYVTLNSFAETEIKSWPSHRVHMRWPARTGKVQII